MCRRVGRELEEPSRVQYLGVPALALDPPRTGSKLPSAETERNDADELGCCRLLEKASGMAVGCGADLKVLKCGLWSGVSLSGDLS